MRIIGDIHSKLNLYQDAIQSGLPNEPDFSIQLGDFGFQRAHDWHMKHIDPKRHKILFGNHDYYPYLKMAHSLENWHFMEYGGLKIFCMRGAKSINPYQWTEGVDWFRNEEMVYTEWQEVIDQYSYYKPDLVITHDCPMNIKQKIYGYIEHSITNHALQACYDIWEPNMWVYGHFHESSEHMFNGTLFKCLAEGETFDI